MRINVSTEMRTVARQLTLPLVGLVAGVAGAGAVTALLPATYQATASVIIMPVSTEASDVTIAQNLAPAMARVAQSREVAQDVGAAIGVSTEDMMGHISGTYELGIPIVTLTASGPTANQAAAAANAAADALRAISARLRFGEQPAVAVQNLDRADAPADPISPTPGLNLALGGFVGLLIGLALKFLRTRTTGVQPAGGPEPEPSRPAHRPVAWPALTDNLRPLSSEPGPGEPVPAAFAQRSGAEPAGSAPLPPLSPTPPSDELAAGSLPSGSLPSGSLASDALPSGSLASGSRSPGRPEQWRGWQQATPPLGTQRRDVADENHPRPIADPSPSRPASADRPATKGPANRPTDRFSADRRRTEALRANQLRASQLRSDRNDAGDSDAAGGSQPDYLTNDPFATDEETP